MDANANENHGLERALAERDPGYDMDELRTKSTSPTGAHAGTNAVNFLELDANPGLEVIEHSNLEVVEPRSGLSQYKTWEKASGLPEMTTTTTTTTTPAPAPAPSYALHQQHMPYGQGAVSGYYDAANPHRLDTAYSSTTGGEYLQPFAASAYDPPSPPDGDKRDEIFGVRRRIFWSIIAVAALLIVIAIALGVGLGLAMHKSSDSTTPISTPSATPTSVSSSNNTVDGLTPIATSSTANNPTIACPANNLTLYNSSTVPGKAYLLVCGRDYNSAQGAIDLKDEPIATVGECLDTCAAQTSCIGAGWGNYNGSNTCWLKSYLGTPNSSPGWYFWIEDDSTAQGDNVTASKM